MSRVEEISSLQRFVIRIEIEMYEEELANGMSWIMSRDQKVKKEHQQQVYAKNELRQIKSERLMRKMNQFRQQKRF